MNIAKKKNEKNIPRSRYIATGVRTDIYNLLVEFEKSRSVRYDDFAKIWREMQFSFIYANRRCIDELIEFTEEILRIAKDFWIPPKHKPNMKFQVGGLYMLFGLYCKQPTQDLVKIRINLDDTARINNFADEMREDGHHDASFILAKLLSLRAFDYCISNYAYGLEKTFRKYFESDKSLKEYKAVVEYPEDVEVNRDIFSNLGNALKQYNKLKCLLNGPLSTTPPEVLQYVDTDIATKLKDIIKECSNDQNIVNIENEPCTSTGITSSKTSMKLTHYERAISSLASSGYCKTSDEEEDSDDENNCGNSINETSWDMPQL